MQNVRAPSYRERGNKYFIALNQNILKFLWMQNVRAPSYREGGNKYIITNVTYMYLIRILLYVIVLTSD